MKSYILIFIVLCSVRDLSKLHRTEETINIGMDLENLTKSFPSLKSELQFEPSTLIYMFNHGREIQSLPLKKKKRDAEICLYTKQSTYSILQIISTGIMASNIVLKLLALLKKLWMYFQISGVIPLSSLMY